MEVWGKDDRRKKSAWKSAELDMEAQKRKVEINLQQWMSIYIVHGLQTVFPWKLFSVRLTCMEVNLLPWKQEPNFYGR